MLEQLIITLKDVTGPRFYFVTVLIFIASLGYIFQEPITVVIKSKTFKAIEFREAKNLSGLKTGIDKILLVHPNIMDYGVYLYQPREEAFYKKLVLSNNEVANTSSHMQGIYLKDQPSLNEAFKKTDYVLFDQLDLQKPDLVYLAKINTSYVLFYKLQINDEIIGEICIRFKQKPTLEEMGVLLPELSPLIYLYIV